MPAKEKNLFAAKKRLKNRTSHTAVVAIAALAAGAAAVDTAGAFSK